LSLLFFFFFLKRVFQKARARIKQIYSNSKEGTKRRRRNKKKESQTGEGEAETSMILETFDLEPRNKEEEVIERPKGRGPADPESRKYGCPVKGCKKSYTHLRAVRFHLKKNHPDH